MSDALERNLAALLTRARPSDGPSPAFVARIEALLDERLPARGRPRAIDGEPRARFRPRLAARALAVAAALLALAGAWLAIEGLIAREDARSPRRAAKGEAASATAAHARRPGSDRAGSTPSGALDPALGAGGNAAERAPLSGAEGELAAGPLESGAEAAAGTTLAPHAARLSFRVVDAATGAPIEACRIWTRREVVVPDVADAELHDFSGGGAAHVGGRFDVPSEPGATHVVVVEASEFAPWRATGLASLAGAEAGEPTEVRIARGRELAGRVSDAETGAPIPGAIVLLESALAHDVIDLHAAYLDPLPATSARTDASGAFRLSNVPAGEAILRASHPGYAPAWSAALDVPAGSAEGAPPLEVPLLELGPGATVVGRVEREGGEPWPGAEVIVSTTPVDGRLAPGKGRAKTFGRAIAGPSGEFEIADLPSGMAIGLLFGSADARLPWPRLQQITLLARETTRLDFLAPIAGGQVRGVLRDAGGEPLAGRDLTLFGLADGAWDTARTASNGTFAFADVPPGERALCLARPGYEDQQVLENVRVTSARALELDVRLPNGAYRLTASTPGGAPLTDGRLALDRETEAGELVFHANVGASGAGSFELDSLPAGRYRATVFARVAGLGHAQLEPFELGAGVTFREHCTLPPGGSLAVRLTRGGAPWTQGGFVLLRDEAGRELMPQLDPRVDGSGARDIVSLAAGRYRVEVGLFDGRKFERAVEVSIGATTTLELDVEAR